MNYKINHLYRVQFTNTPSVKILDIKNHEYKVLLFPYDKAGEPVERILDFSTIKLLCYQEFNPSLSVEPYPYPISDEDLEEIQSFFKSPISKEMIIQAIELENWGGDWTDIIKDFGIASDTCNREYVVSNLEKILNLKST